MRLINNCEEFANKIGYIGVILNVVSYICLFENE